MSQTSVRSDLYQTADVQGDLPSEVSFHAMLTLDHFTQLAYFGFSLFLGDCLYGNMRFGVSAT